MASTPRGIDAHDPTAHEPAGEHNPKQAAASGFIGSALEYYDFFIYAQAASLIFPDIFFPKGNPTVAIVASLATYGVGYVARPIGAFFLGRWGDTHGRKNVLVLCMFLMGLSTMAVAALPTYQQVGILAPILLVILRLVQGFAVAGEISGASSMIVEHAPFGRRGYFASFSLQGTQFGQILAAAVFLPLAHFMSDDSFNSWGWRIPFLLSAFVIIAGWYIRRNVHESPAFVEELEEGAIPESPIAAAFRLSGADMFRVMCMALMNVIPTVATIFGATYATNKDYGIGFHKDVYLWIPVVGNLVACLIIPFVGSLSDRIGRRIPIVVGALGSGILAPIYLFAISKGNLPASIILSILMWGIVYQGYNAVFPSFYPELFQTKVRVTAMAVSQNIGTMLTAFFPAMFAAIAPGSRAGQVPYIVGGFAFVITCISAAAAWSARETYNIHVDDLGTRNAVAIPREEYLAQRAAAGGGTFS